MKPKLPYPWSLLKEPKFISGVHATAYVILLLNGIAIMAAQNGDLTTQIGMPLAVLIGGCLIIGGGLGAASLNGGEWWMERAGIWFIFGGLICYIIALWAVSHSTSESLIRTNFTIAFFLLFLVRFYRIRGATLDPTK